MSFTCARLPRMSTGALRRTSQRTWSSSPASLGCSLPTIATCPSPTCECAPMPPNLDIDRHSPLLNTMPAYSEQVILCTGKSDWHSNIEQDDGATGAFVKGLKGVIGKGGEAFDPFHNVVITASSLPASQVPNTTTALLFPAFAQIAAIPHTTESWSDFATAYLKARKLHPMHDGLATEQKAKLVRDEEAATRLPAAHPITKPTVLICGHGGRDQRCGILGPVLQSSFEKELQRHGIEARVAQISHIGGHKYAGNVIIYLPPTLPNTHALAGTGIWYGRVGPEHVQGLVEETIVNGRVIVDLLRGGITTDGGNIGRMVEAQMAKASGDEGTLKLKPRMRG